jgi:hypothetical protein
MDERQVHDATEQRIVELPMNRDDVGHALLDCGLGEVLEQLLIDLDC